MVYTLRVFPLQNAVCFIILTYLVPELFTFCIQSVIKLKKYILMLCFRASWYKSNETPTLCNTVQVLFLQSHSTCFGRKRPSSEVFKTIMAATGTCVIVAGKSTRLLIRAGMNACFGHNKEM